LKFFFIFFNFYFLKTNINYNSWIPSIPTEIAQIWSEIASVMGKIVRIILKMGSVLLHTLNGVLHTKRRRAKNDLTLHTVCKIFKEKN
jgi:hypothetical protein